MPVAGVLVNRVLSDDFSPAERAELMEVVESNQLFGKGRFLALLDNRRSLERVRSKTDVPIATVPEFAETNDQLLESVADTLLKRVN